MKDATPDISQHEYEKRIYMYRPIDPGQSCTKLVNAPAIPTKTAAQRQTSCSLRLTSVVNMKPDLMDYPFLVLLLWDCRADSCLFGKLLRQIIIVIQIPPDSK
ncbi:hypothetical protein V2G26_013146 [Clonostachys chloroleuca]